MQPSSRGGPIRLTGRERIQRELGRLLGALPPALQVRLSGKPPIVVEGDTLAPEIQLALAMLERRGDPRPETLTPNEAREARRRLSAIYAGRPPVVGSVRDLQIDANVALDARHYAPAEAGGPHPLLVYYHGGGFLFGDLETHDGVCRLLCRHSGAHVLAIDYRLAPEHPFPAAVEDAVGAFSWAMEHAAQLGADPARVGVGGDSAGGNLSAVVSQLTAREAGCPPALQLLIYPVTDMTRRRPSRDLFADGFLLTSSEMDWFEANYLGVAAAEVRSDPRVSPLMSETLAGLPPAIVVTASFDPLRDEGEDYARAMQEAGTPVLLRRFPGMIHAFINMTSTSRLCRDNLVEIAGILRGAFAALGGSQPAPAAGEDTVAAPILGSLGP
ncbi:MAG TPA: alpha/beta hydrolase [Solirubrobacteraceae bacterium]